MSAIGWIHLPHRHLRPSPVDRHGDVAGYFDVESSHYADAYAGDTHVGLFFRLRRDLVAAELSRLPPGSLLDVGCGPGVMAPTCRALGFEYCGVDISPAMIETARSRNRLPAGVSFVEGEATRLPVPDASQDVVLCLGMLEYLDGDEEGAALAEFGRVLRPGGVLVVSWLNAASPILVLRHLRQAVWRRLAWPAPDDHMGVRLGRSGLRRMIEGGGYRIRSMRGFDYSPVPAHIHDRHGRFWARVAQRLDWLAGTPLAWLALGYLVVADLIPSG